MKWTETERRQKERKEIHLVCMYSAMMYKHTNEQWILCKFSFNLLTSEHYCVSTIQHHDVDFCIPWIFGFFFTYFLFFLCFLHFTRNFRRRAKIKVINISAHTKYIMKSLICLSILDIENRAQGWLIVCTVQFLVFVSL